MSLLKRILNKKSDSLLPGDIYIGRPSIFGNPFSYLAGTRAQFSVSNRKEAIEKFGQYFHARIDSDPDFKNKVLQLKGKRLTCWCAPLPCHAEVILDWLDRHALDHIVA